MTDSKNPKAPKVAKNLASKAHFDRVQSFEKANAAKVLAPKLPLANSIVKLSLAFRSGRQLTTEELKDAIVHAKHPIGLPVERVTLDAILSFYAAEVQALTTSKSKISDPITNSPNTKI